MRENKHNNSTNECIDASNYNQNNYQGQNSQDNILKISIIIDSIHAQQKKELKNYIIFSLLS